MEKEMVLVKEENLTKRKIREKIEIEMNEYCLNRNKGKRLSDIWTCYYIPLETRTWLSQHEEDHTIKELNIMR